MRMRVCQMMRDEEKLEDRVGQWDLQERVLDTDWMCWYSGQTRQNGLPQSL